MVTLLFYSATMAGGPTFFGGAVLQNIWPSSAPGLEMPRRTTRSDRSGRVLPPLPHRPVCKYLIYHVTLPNCMVPSCELPANLEKSKFKGRRGAGVTYFPCTASRTALFGICLLHAGYSICTPP